MGHIISNRAMITFYFDRVEGVSREYAFALTQISILITNISNYASLLFFFLGKKIKVTP